MSHFLNFSHLHSPFGWGPPVRLQLQLASPTARSVSGSSLHTGAAHPVRLGQAASPDTVTLSPTSDAPSGVTPAHSAVKIREFPIFDKDTATLYQLKNGLHVLLYQDKRVPIMNVADVVNVGAHHELPGQEGMAHFIEHLIAEGEQDKNNKLFRQLLQQGLKSNAYTSPDVTVYHTHLVPKAQFKNILNIHAQRIPPHIPFQEEDVQREKGVIQEEIALYNENIFSKAQDYLYKALFDKTTYGHHTLGTKESVSSFTHEGLKAFYNQHYHPKNRLVIVSGDFDNADDVLGHVEAVYGKEGPPGWKPFQLPETQMKNLTSSPQEGKQRQFTNTLSQQHGIAEFGFRLPFQPPNKTAPDETLKQELVPSLLTHMLNGEWQQESLQKKLVRDQAKLTGCNVFYLPLQQTGAFGWFTVGEKAKLKETEPMIWNHLQALKQSSNISQRSLDAAKTQFRVRSSELKESVEGRVELLTQLGSRWLQSRDATLPPTGVPLERFQQKVLDEITPQDLRQWANHHLPKDTQPLNKIWVLPGKAPDSSPPIKSASGKQISAQRFGGQLPDTVQRRQIDTAEVLVNHQPDAPRLSVSLSLPRHNPQQIRGNDLAVYALAQGLLEEGTKTLPPKEFNQMLDEHGLDFGVSLGSRALQFTVTGLPEKKEAMLDVLRHLITGPTTDPKVLAKVKRELVASIDLQKASEDYQAEHYLVTRHRPANQPDHPLTMSGETVIKQAQKLDPRTIESKLKEFLGSQYMTLSASGPMTLDEATDWCREIQKALPESRVKQQPLLIKTTANTLNLFSHPELTNQAIVKRQWILPELRDAKDDVLLSLVPHYLNSGILFNLFRNDDQQLSYTTQISLGAFGHQKRMVLASHTDGDKLPQSLWTIQEAIKEASDKPISLKQLRGVINTRRISMMNEQQEQENIARDLTKHRQQGGASYQDKMALLDELEKNMPDTAKQFQQLMKKMFATHSTVAITTSQKVLDKYKMTPQVEKTLTWLPFQPESGERPQFPWQVQKA